MRILITGGLGFIGSHIARAAMASGHFVHTFDNLLRGHLEFSKFGGLTVGDIRNTDLLRTVMIQQRIDAIVHCAALAYVEESAERPNDYYSTNVGGTMSLCHAAEAAGVRNIVFASSCSVYGDPAQTPVTEDSTLAPISVYAQTKALAESVLSSYSSLKTISLRFFNAAGAEPQFGIGESHNPETHIIPRLIRFAYGLDDQPLTIFSGGINQGDGFPRRDFVHVSDIARAHLSALKYLQKGTAPLSEVFNIGSGRSTSLYELIRLVEQISGRHFRDRLVYAQRRPCDPVSIYADITKARKNLKWDPVLSIERAICDSIDWCTTRSPLNK
jgi:UDP-glucose-4-epimerase GalE